ncbi:MAG: thiamine/thiamine pyrophosphate ABC transporter permease ThiP [Pseudomonadota bacterium]
MAGRAVPVIPGGAAGALVVGLTLGTLAAVALRADGPAALGPADWAAVRFTLVQAVLSAVLSVALAIPVARALARRRFPGRQALVTLMGAPFVLPVIVAILGLLAVFGRGGIVNQALAALELPPISIYGLHGVVLAHVFFNLPLCVRLLLQGWSDIPAERFRLAASLGMGPGEIRRQLETPMLRAVVPGALAVVFLICMTSFAVALTLGGGPRATTVELAIYQAFRFDFDLGRAALLGGLQMALTVAAGLLALWFARTPAFGAGLDRPPQRWDAAPGWDWVWIALAALFLLVPMAMVAIRGAEGIARLEAGVWSALAQSLAVALAATVLTLTLAVPLAIGARRVRGLDVVGYLPIAASALVLGTGLFILLFPFVDPGQLTLPVTALVNALLALPFAVRVLRPAVDTIEAAHGRLADSLGLTGWSRVRWLLLPRLRPALGFAAGLSAALAMGDLGVVTLFAPPDGGTLPLYIFRLMGSFQMEAAGGAAVILLAASLALFLTFDRWGRAGA